MAATPRRILLADADAFYVAVARLVDPDGAGRARLLIVGGSPERRGVVTSASYEARAFGVRSAMPMARAVRLCPEATVVAVPWEACAAKGRAIREVLERFAPVVEQASSDEFYLDLSGTERLYHDETLAQTAGRIRAAVHESTALWMSIGGGTSKLVAKLAAGVAKPAPGAPGAGVHVVAPGSEVEFLAGFALADIPMIGPKAQERLARLGWHRAADVQRVDRSELARRLGEREGAWLWERVRGLDDSGVEPWSEPKSISRDNTFPADLDGDDDLLRELLIQVDRATADLRADGLVARTITVRLRDADFTTRQAGRTLPEPVFTDRAVFDVARELLAKLRAARRVPARLIGVALSQLDRPGVAAQLALLEAEQPGSAETEKDRQLARAIDAVRDKFGPDALGRARTQGWKG
ncbi:MAG TPA: DNA polymerase IV [Gemmatimonadales bacterium]|nr:DNA polymerase IV [Gemmatimonadales bacterium]